MAKINFKTLILKDLNGAPMHHFIEKEVENEKKPVEVETTLADVIQTNLLAENASITSTERFDRFRLASKVKDSTDATDFTVEELALIKKVTGESRFPIVVGRVWEAVEALEKKSPK